MREFWFDSNETRLFAVEDGGGPVIVMLHGGMANHLAALPLIAPLAPQYRVVAPDLRGSGRSFYGAPLTFDQLSDDLESLLDHLEVETAIVGGVSSGSGVAVRFALRHASRTLGLVLVRPVYAGEARGYTQQQEATFARMNSVASQALDKGVQVLRPLYANLPPHLREGALAMIDGLDAASVVATGEFLASGTQPFGSATQLESLAVPTLLVRADDPVHPAEVSDLYAKSIPNCEAAPPTAADIPATIRVFAEKLRLTA